MNILPNPCTVLYFIHARLAKDPNIISTYSTSKYSDIAFGTSVVNEQK